MAQPHIRVKVISQIAYAILAVCIIPGIITGLTYATSTIDFVLLILFAVYFVCLVYLMISNTMKFRVPVFVIGTTTTLAFLYAMSDLFMHNEGTDPKAIILFSAITIISIVTLILIRREIGESRSTKQ